MNTQSRGGAVITGASTGIGAIHADHREFVTIPALSDAGKWQAYEAARQTLQFVSQGAGGQVRDRSHPRGIAKC